MTIMIHNTLMQRIKQEITRTVITFTIGYLTALSQHSFRTEEGIFAKSELKDSSNYSVIYSVEKGMAIPYLAYRQMLIPLSQDEAKEDSIDKLVRRYVK